MPVRSVNQKPPAKQAVNMQKRRNSPVCPAGADGGSERAAGLAIKSPLNVRTVPYSAESVSELRTPLKVSACYRIWLFMPCQGPLRCRRRRSPTGSTQHAGRRNILTADCPVRVKVIPQELALPHQ